MGNGGESEDGQRGPNTSNLHGPDGPDESWLESQAFENASYHGWSAQTGPRGAKSAAPEDGAAALQNSYRVSDNAPRRIGVDTANKQFVVLDRTKEKLWHGHTRSWDQLTQAMRGVLIRNGVADLRGKIIAP